MRFGYKTFNYIHLWQTWLTHRKVLQQIIKFRTWKMHLRAIWLIKEWKPMCIIIGIWIYFMRSINNNTLRPVVRFNWLKIEWKLKWWLKTYAKGTTRQINIDSHIPNNNNSITVRARDITWISRKDTILTFYRILRRKFFLTRSLCYSSHFSHISNAL